MASSRLPETVQGILDTPMGEDVALPELAEIDKSGGYEIAEVATALNVVQKSAAELAVEQAVLRRNIADSFVNLGRRNQNLLSRQLESITDMERSETDPDELKKLFTLDHLATRMRRNAESLLLLAGLEPHRQWSAPVAIVDILRGALGEVEDYDRVSIRKLDAATLKGKAAADITHLIAELLENALRYSPGDVEIIGRQMGEGYTLAIVDNGVGMGPEEMAQANIRLAGAESFTVAPSKYLGHYVVGRQADRLEVGVQLSDSPKGGVTATIELGAILSTDDGTSIQDEPDFSAEALVPERFQRDAEEPTDPEAADKVDIAWGVDEDPDDDESEHVEAGTLAEALPPAPATAEAAAGPEVEKTASGYAKRVRGAQAPSGNVLAAREADTQDAPTFGGAAGVRNALSGLQAGRQKARDEASPIDDEEVGR
jgi:anti-sigma regulatory factor (Ser/Thr protein kinase)